MSDTLLFDHVHLSAPNQGEASQWYVDHLDATPGVSPDRVLVGDKLWLIFYQAPHAKPSREGTIESIGFSFRDAARKIAALEAAGATVVQPLREEPGAFPMGIVEDPFGVRILILQNLEAEGLDHVRLRVPDPDRALGWLVEMFGGERIHSMGHDAVRYGRVMVVAEAGEAEPSEGHAIDHLGWRTAHLDTVAAELKSKEVVFTMEPRQFNPQVRISFVNGPAGMRVEVLQRS